MRVLNLAKDGHFMAAAEETHSWLFCKNCSVFHRKVLNFTSILELLGNQHAELILVRLRKPWWRAMVWVQKDGLMKMKTRRDIWRSCPIQNQRVANLETIGDFQTPWIVPVSLLGYIGFLGCSWCCWETSGNDFSWIELGATILRMRMPLKVLAENCCNLRHRCFNQPELPSVQVWSPMTTWWLHGKQEAICANSLLHSTRQCHHPRPGGSRSSDDILSLGGSWCLSLDSFTHNCHGLRKQIHGWQDRALQGRIHRRQRMRAGHAKPHHLVAPSETTRWPLQPKVKKLWYCRSLRWRKGLGLMIRTRPPVCEKF